MAEETRPRLGRGLAALIGDAAEDFEPKDVSRSKRFAPIEFLRPNPRNPRKSFDSGELDELAESIRERGIVQPILVRAVPQMENIYEIIAGERRWRAAQRVGLHEVPIVVVEASDRESLEIAIIENVQRTDLNPLEEALGYQQLADEFHYNHADLAKIIGKSRSHIANMIRLLKLPDEVKQYLIDGQISSGHARALLTVDHPEQLARRIVEEGLTVRDIERLAQDDKGPSKSEPSPKKTVEKDADTRALERVLTDTLGLNVAIANKGEAGEIKIRYKTLDQLDALCRRLQT